MILTCPECSTRFMIDPAMLGETGRTVKCSKCAHTWLQTPPEDAVAAAESDHRIESALAEIAESAVADDGGTADAAPEETDADAFEAAAASRRAKRVAAAAARRPPQRGRAGAVLWTLLVIAVVGVLGAGFALRDAVVQAWPAAESIYAMIGLHGAPPGAGLGLRNVSWKAGERNGARVLTVQGEVANVSKDVREVPKIQGVLFDKENKELQRWTFSAPESRLLPGENVAFETELENPAEGASRLTIVFADRR